MNRLSAFNRRINEFYWQVQEPQAAFESKPCFTKQEMKNFEHMREDELRLVFKMRSEGVEIAWPKDWRMFRIQQEALEPNTEGAKRAGDILDMLKGRK